MSEYEYVGFRAIDRPLSDAELEFAERQSTRAEVTRRTFDVEYHYSSFHGDVERMLCGGYDIYLTYSNYGTRNIKLRFSRGLPLANKATVPYLDDEMLTWKKDRKGEGGILSVNPYIEEALEPIFDFEKFFDAASHVRQLLLNGDLRGLYLLWLCVSIDDRADATEWIEPRVPHGLGQIPEMASELLNFFDSDPLLLRAAASGVPDIGPDTPADRAVGHWLETLSAKEAKRIVERLVNEDSARVKSDVLSAFHDANSDVDWPCTTVGRTVAELFEQHDVLCREENARQERQAKAKEKRKAAKAERERRARMKEMTASPQIWLDHVDNMVSQRGTQNYRDAAELLADLRDAIGGDHGDKIAQSHAARLIKKYPTLNVLKSSLRKRGLVP